MKGNFIDNLPKIYGIYTGGFIGFIIIMAIAEQIFLLNQLQLKVTKYRIQDYLSLVAKVCFLVILKKNLS